ncbi:MAG: hypothetical protein V1867_00750 [Candidatus Falkowbacteria bacterium]
MFIKGIKELSKELFTHLLVLVCLISAMGAAVYRVYALNSLGVLLGLALALGGAAVLFFWGYRRGRLNNNVGHTVKEPAKQAPGTGSVALVFLYALFTGSCFAVLFTNKTDLAIISPWEVVPGFFFAFFCLATIALMLILARADKIGAPMITLLLMTHYFLSFAVATIVYELGFGFDPFIHGATMDLIDKTGAVAPKPFYYLGQYALITIVHKISFIPIDLLQKFLVPLLAAIYLPRELLKLLGKWFSDASRIGLTVLLVLVIPFSIFIVTTPQNLAYLFLLLAIIRGLSCADSRDLAIIYLLAFAALATQPIAGIPALMFALILTVYHSDIKSIKPDLNRLILLLNAAVLPAAFFLLNRGKTPAGGTTEPPADTPGLSALSVPGEENFMLNFVYLYGANIAIVILALALSGFLISRKYKRECRVFPLYLSMAGSLLVSYFLTVRLPFDFLIYYERGDYAGRILTVALFFLLPYVLLSIHYLVSGVGRQNRFIRYAWVGFGALTLTASLYLSYPRLDNYFNSRGFSTGSRDISAVRWINEDAGNGDYVVLANQQVSAAALKEFGFKKYFPGDIFFYPVPTGGPLYRYYLDMVYKTPDRATALAAMDFAGVDTAYFVLNKYWWAFPKILNEAKLEADFWLGFDDEVYVFKYQK